MSKVSEVRSALTKNLTKVVDLEVLAAEVQRLKLTGRTVAHCHGVFDLLHVGHIWHLQQAKQRADVLVVTLTPDEFVNKGPHRPAFSQDLRAEALAALETVDYVAINKWPTAVEAIKQIKPDWYVKGSDYKNAADDRTGKIVDERQAVESVGGNVLYTDGQTYSSTALINNYLSEQSDATREFLQRIRSNYSFNEIVSMVDSLQQVRVLTIGEAIIDEYQYCEAIGKSSKEPTLVVKLDRREAFLGGILAIANHMSGFAGQTGVLTQLGSEDGRQDKIREELNPAISWHGLTRHNAPTIVKRRYIDNYFFSKLFETYEINDEHLSAQDERVLIEALVQEIGNYDMVLVADYGHGLFTDSVVQTIKEHAPYLAVNVQSNAGSLGYQSMEKYKGANFFSIDETELRLEARDRRGDVGRLVQSVGEATGGDTFFVTRGKHGSVCYRPQQELAFIPAVAGKVVDRVGAGDAFLAITALGVKQNLPIDVTGLLGSVAGAMAVAMVGNKRPLTKLDLVRSLESLLK